MKFYYDLPHSNSRFTEARFLSLILTTHVRRTTSTSNYPKPPHPKPYQSYFLLIVRSTPGVSYLVFQSGQTEGHHGFYSEYEMTRESQTSSLKYSHSCQPTRPTPVLEPLVRLPQTERTSSFVRR